LGVRIQCAKCHNHPYEPWTQDDYYGLSAFFHRVQRKKVPPPEEPKVEGEEKEKAKKKKKPGPDEYIISMSKEGEVRQPTTGQVMRPTIPGSSAPNDLAKIDESVDRRETFTRWLATKENPYFSRVEVNRIWSEVMGRGIVEPIDDFRSSNPPSNAKLLDALALDFAEHDFDRRHILRTILNSRTYQASSRTNGFNRDDSKHFSHFSPHRLSAEQLLDAIGTVTGVPDRFKNQPEEMKATQLLAPDIVEHEFLKVFGQPSREQACQCERGTGSNLGQALHLFNGQLVHQKLRDAKNRFHHMMSKEEQMEEALSELFFVAYSREINDREKEIALAYIQNHEDRKKAFEDISWTVLNSNEFLFQR